MFRLPKFQIYETQKQTRNRVVMFNHNGEEILVPIEYIISTREMGDGQVYIELDVQGTEWALENDIANLIIY